MYAETSCGSEMAFSKCFLLSTKMIFRGVSQLLLLFSKIYAIVQKVSRTLASISFLPQNLQYGCSEETKVSSSPSNGFATLKSPNILWF